MLEQPYPSIARPEFRCPNGLFRTAQILRGTGKGSGEGVFPPQNRGSGGITHEKNLKFETQFSAIWCILATIDSFPVFHLYEQNISIMQVV